MAAYDERHRLVILGSGRVGKTAILQRFLTGMFVEKYKATVEDLICKEFAFPDVTIKVDILDTAGNLEFPAMRRLNISNATAFLLVSSMNDRGSFVEMQSIWEQIKETRLDYGDIPCVFVLNKNDILNGREVQSKDVTDWLAGEGRADAFIESSAASNENIIDIFEKLIEQAKRPLLNNLHQLVTSQKKRQASVKIKRSGSPNISTNRLLAVNNDNVEELRRSRSLIRRGSRKKKQAQQVNECGVQ